MTERTTEAFIMLAREDYCSDDLEIDDEPQTSPSEAGTWVAAWVWVSNEEVDELNKGLVP